MSQEFSQRSFISLWDIKSKKEKQTIELRKVKKEQCEKQSKNHSQKQKMVVWPDICRTDWMHIMVQENEYTDKINYYEVYKGAINERQKFRTTHQKVQRKTQNYQNRGGGGSRGEADISLFWNNSLPGTAAAGSTETEENDMVEVGGWGCAWAKNDRGGEAATEAGRFCASENWGTGAEVRKEGELEGANIRGGALRLCCTCCCCWCWSITKVG